MEGMSDKFSNFSADKEHHFPAESDERARVLTDHQLYRMVYLESEEQSPQMLEAARREMDRHAVSLKTIAKSKTDSSAATRKPSASTQYRFFDPKRRAPYFAFSGLVGLAIAVLYHWFGSGKITEKDILLGIFRLCISAALYLYLSLRRKPRRGRRSNVPSSGKS